MSTQAAVAFLATVAADVDVRTQLDDKLAEASDRLDAFVDFASQKGHEFSARELADALAGEGALSEEQLDRVAGGFNPQPEPPPASLSDIRLRYSTLLQPSLEQRGLQR